jgi:uncharacterized protein YaaQ
MKLVVAIIHNDDAGSVVDALLQHEYRATRVNSSGGFLRKSNVTLLIGVEEAAVDEVIALIRSHTRARSQVHAAESSAPPKRRADLRPGVVFVVDLEGFSRL